MHIYTNIIYIKSSRISDTGDISQFLLDSIENGEGAALPQINSKQAIEIYDINFGRNKSKIDFENFFYIIDKYKNLNEFTVWIHSVQSKVEVADVALKSVKKSVVFKFLIDETPVSVHTYQQ